MTDIDKELARQIHELNKEVKGLAERVALLASMVYRFNSTLKKADGSVEFEQRD